MKKILQLSGFVGGLLAPLSFVFAQDAGTILVTIINIIQLIIQVLIIAAIAYFIFGIVWYVIAKGAEGKEEGKKHMINGLIGLFVIVAFWGIIAIVQNTFGVSNVGNSPTVGPGGVPCVIGVNC